MATIETLPEPRLGEPGEACAECGSPLAADQRYCLECGTRRGDPRLDYGNYLKNGGGDEPPNGSAGSRLQAAGLGSRLDPVRARRLGRGARDDARDRRADRQGRLGRLRAGRRPRGPGRRHRHRHGLRRHQPADRQHVVQERLAVRQGGLHGRARHPAQAGDDGRPGRRRRSPTRSPRERRTSARSTPTTTAASRPATT